MKYHFAAQYFFSFAFFVVKICAVSIYLCSYARSPKGMIVQGVVQQLMLWTKAGRSPNRNTPRGTSQGELLLTNWRAVSAKGVSEAFFLFVFLLLFQSAKLVVNWTRGVTPGCILIGLSARLCCVYKSVILKLWWLKHHCVALALFCLCRKTVSEGS